MSHEIHPNGAADAISKPVGGFLLARKNISDTISQVMGKTRVGILFGGKSAEHEVSLQSAKNIIDAIDKDKYEVILVGIDKTGQWHLSNASQFLLNSNNPKLIKLNQSGESLAVVPGQTQNQLVSLTPGASNRNSTLFFRCCTARSVRTARCRDC